MPEWQLLPFAVVRMAGFPMSEIAHLQNEEVVRYAERIRVAEESRRRAARGRRENRSDATSAENAATAVDKATADFAHVLKQSVADVSRHLHKTFRRDPLLRASLMLSNENGWSRLRPWLDKDLPRQLVKQDRRNAEALAMYLQRVCTKNDTASHYGPFAPAEFTGRRAALRVDSTRLRYPLLSRWATNEIVRTMQRDPTLQPSLKVRAHPGYSHEADASYLVVLDHTRRATFLRDVMRCEVLDFSREAVQFMNAVRESSVLEHRGALELAVNYGLTQDQFNDLLASGVLQLGPFVPYGEGDPLPYLIEAVPPDHPTRLLLQRCVDSVSAFGNRQRPDDLHRLEAVNAAVHTLAPIVEDDKQGATFYSDRSFVHEECIGPLRSLQLPESVRAEVQRLSQPLLDLFMLRPRVCHSVRRTAQAQWFSSTFADRSITVREYVTACLSDPHGLRDIAEEVAQAGRDVDDAVHSALQVASSTSRHELDPTALADVVRRLDQDEPAICNPDIMVQAASLSAIENNDFEIVVGDLHADEDNLTHSLFGPYLNAFFPTLPAIVRAAYESLLRPSEQLLDVTLYHRNKTFLRQSIGLPDLELQDIAPASSQKLYLSDLSISRTPTGLRLHRHGFDESFRLVALPLAWTGIDFNPFETFGFPQRDGAPLLPLAQASHLPRLSVGRCVLQREIWSIPADDIPRGSLENVVLECQRLRLRHNLPRQIFVKSTNEPKPVYVDFNSPLLLKNFASMARKTTNSLVLQEVFPDSEGLWNHAFGIPVTSELRCTAVSASYAAEGVPS